MCLCVLSVFMCVCALSTSLCVLFSDVISHFYALFFFLFFIEVAKNVLISLPHRIIGSVDVGVAGVVIGVVSH